MTCGPKPLYLFYQLKQVKYYTFKQVGAVKRTERASLRVLSMQSLISL